MTDRAVYVKAITGVAAYLLGSRAKAAAWMRNADPGLGGPSPINLIRMGRIRELSLCVMTALAERKPLP